MIFKNIHCPGGKPSQTGTAVSERYEGVGIEDCGLIEDIQGHLDKSAEIYYSVPIWNSHQGEISKASYVWNLITEGKIKLFDIWAKKIEFWFVKKIEQKNEYKKIGSVAVAQTQCSDFLIKKGVELVSCPLTTVAYDLYKKGEKWDGVLVAPGQGDNEHGLEIVERETANPNNFTSFVTLSSMPISVESATGVYVFGASMSPLQNTLKDSEQSFFKNLLESAENLDGVPKLIFVFNRPSKVGLLFEGARVSPGDLLDSEELNDEEVSIHEDVGVIQQGYSEQLKNLFASKFAGLSEDKFILHSGKNACLFACPPLGIYTHGYEVHAVEPVFRFYIGRLFSLIYGGLNCTPIQRKFFEEWKGAWEADRGNFIKFTQI